MKAEIKSHCFSCGLTFDVCLLHLLHGTILLLLKYYFMKPGDHIKMHIFIQHVWLEPRVLFVYLGVLKHIVTIWYLTLALNSLYSLTGFEINFPNIKIIGVLLL